MRKTCAMCPAEFEAKRPAAKYCSERCKKRAQRQPGGTEAKTRKPAPSVQSPMECPAGSPLVEATLAELRRAGRDESASGVAAVALATRIDASMFSAETGAGVAAMVREHRAALADAVKDAGKAADPLDELRSRRERKRSAG